MIKVYCDTGGYRPELRELQNQGKIGLVMFPYENTNKKIDNSGSPSAAQWNDMKNLTWDTVQGTWDDYKVSPKHAAIADLIGRENRPDVLHVDSAYKSGCSVFFARDGHILSQSERLESLLNMKVFHPNNDWSKFLAFLDERR